MLKVVAKSPDFVVAMNVDVLIQVTGIANFARDGDEVSERLADGLGGLHSRENADNAGDERAQGGKTKADVAGTFSRLRGFVRGLSDVRVCLIEDSRGFRKPGRGIFLQIEDLKVGDGGVAGVDLMPLGKQRLGKIVGPTCFGAFDLNQRGFKAVVVGLRLATLDQVVDVSKSFVDLFFVAGIAAQEEIVHVVAVQHDLVAH